MGLTDGHTIVGFLIGRVFHSWRPRQPLYIPAHIPDTLPAALRESLRHPRSVHNASLRRYLVAGALLCNLPDLDVLVALALRSWTKHHRGPTHSIFFNALCSILLSVPLSKWLRVSRRRSLLFCSLCLTSHLLHDWIGTAGVPLWWPLLPKKKSALGVVTVWDVPINVTLYVAFVAARWTRKPTAVSAVALAMIVLYLRQKWRQMQIASAFFHSRHLLSPGPDYWIHPWALFFRTFSLCRRSDGRVLDTVSTSTIASPSRQPFNNACEDATVARKMYFANRGILMDTISSSMLTSIFWTCNIVWWWRKHQKKINA